MGLGGTRVLWAYGLATRCWKMSPQVEYVLRLPNGVEIRRRRPLVPIDVVLILLGFRHRFVTRCSSLQAAIRDAVFGANSRIRHLRCSRCGRHAVRLEHREQSLEYLQKNGWVRVFDGVPLMTCPRCWGTD